LNPFTAVPFGTPFVTNGVNGRVTTGATFCTGTLLMPANRGSFSRDVFGLPTPKLVVAELAKMKVF
jgi:hypothetical protein